MSMVSWSGILVKGLHSYIVGNKIFTGKIYILNLRNKRKSIFAIVIFRYYGWKKIIKATGKIIIKCTYCWNNRTKFRKCITTGKLVHFRSTIDTSKSRTKIQFIIYIFVKKRFCFNLHKKRCSEASRFKVGSSLSFSTSDVSEIISWIALS